MSWSTMLISGKGRLSSKSSCLLIACRKSLTGEITTTAVAKVKEVNASPHEVAVERRGVSGQIQKPRLYLLSYPSNAPDIDPSFLYLPLLLLLFIPVSDGCITFTWPRLTPPEESVPQPLYHSTKSAFTQSQQLRCSGGCLVVLFVYSPGTNILYYRERMWVSISWVWSWCDNGLGTRKGSSFCGAQGTCHTKWW